MGFLCLFMHLRSLCCFDHFLSGKTELIPSHKNKNLPTQHEPRDFNKGFIFIFYFFLGGGGCSNLLASKFPSPIKGFLRARIVSFFHSFAQPTTP